jgi:hypothetical protein
VSGPLQLETIDGQSRYMLDGEPLIQGEPVELLLDGNTWLRGAWEWSGQEIRWPGLRFKLGGDAPVYARDTSRTAIVALPPNAVLRRTRR